MNTIIHDLNGEIPIFNVEVIDNPEFSDIHCVLAHSALGFPFDAVNVFEFDPEFTNRNAGHLTLTPGSEAIDRCGQVVPGYDLAFNARNSDITGVGNGVPNISDMGAFEFTDLIFADEFE